MNARPALLSTCHWFALLTLTLIMIAARADASPVCSFNYTERNEITAMSRSFPGRKCEFFLRAPNQSTIVLNFTKLYGFQSGSNVSETSTHSPVVETGHSGARFYSKANLSSSAKTEEVARNCETELQIWKLGNGSDKSVLQTLCGKGDNLKTPHVFHTNSTHVRVLYKWEPGQDSGFTLDFSFQQSKDICKFGCTGCQTGSSPLCTEGKTKCQDGSQKANCNITVSPKGGAALISEYIPIIVIVPVVFLLGVCVVIYYVLVLRAWRDPRPPGTVAMERRSQLHPREPSSSNSSQSTTVYVPNSPRDRLQRQGVAGREFPSSQRALVVDLPPHIPISEDGEESFAHYQRLLQRPLNPRNSETIRPPPNMTVYDRESPPSYHSHSSSRGENLDQETSGIARLLSRDCNGWSTRLPCRRPPGTTSSSLSNLVNSMCNVGGHSRRSRHESSESSGSVSHSLDQPPPEYSVVMAGHGTSPPLADPSRAPYGGPTNSPL